MSSQLRGSLFGRVAFGIIAGFLLLHALTLVYFGHERMVAEAGVFAASTAERALTIAEVASAQPEILKLLATPAFELSVEQEALEKPPRVWPHSDEVGAVLLAKLDELGVEHSEQVRFWYVNERRETWLVLQLPMPDGWLTVRAEGPDVRGHTVVATFWMTSLAVLILLIVLAATRRYTRVLPELADAAERIGRTAEPKALESRGPRAKELVESIEHARASTRVCAECFNLDETDPCRICSDESRDREVLLVVEDPRDVSAFEESGFRGIYHVLQGRVSSLEGIGPDDLTIGALRKRLGERAPREIVLATNPDLEGEGTAQLLVDQLRDRGSEITRIARGIPAGSVITQVSKSILADAVEGRRPLT